MRADQRRAAPMRMRGCGEDRVFQQVFPLAREFLTRHYHLPSDETGLSIHYPTAARLARVNERIGTIVANDPKRPTWKAGDFFGEKFGKPAP